MKIFNQYIIKATIKQWLLIVSIAGIIITSITLIDATHNIASSQNSILNILGLAAISVITLLFRINYFLLGIASFIVIRGLHVNKQIYAIYTTGKGKMSLAVPVMIVGLLIGLTNSLIFKSIDSHLYNVEEQLKESGKSDKPITGYLVSGYSADGHQMIIYAAQYKYNKKESTKNFKHSIVTVYEGNSTLVNILYSKDISINEDGIKIDNPKFFLNKKNSYDLINKIQFKLYTNKINNIFKPINRTSLMEKISLYLQYDFRLSNMIYLPSLLSNILQPMIFVIFAIMPLCFKMYSDRKIKDLSNMTYMALLMLLIEITLSLLTTVKSPNFIITMFIFISGYGLIFLLFLYRLIRMHKEIS